MSADHSRRILAVVGVLGALTAIVAGAAVALRTARLGFRAARFSLRAATFSLRRSCPDCKERIHRDARVCRYCGFRFARSPGGGSVS